MAVLMSASHSKEVFRWDIPAYNLRGTVSCTDRIWIRGGSKAKHVLRQVVILLTPN